MDIKKELVIGFALSMIAAIFTGYYITHYKAAAPSTDIRSQTAVFTAAEIARHSAANDCWIIVQNNVYNITNYLDQHPGGREQVILYCGRDATQAFLTQGGNGSHSQRAFQILESLKIGSLK